MYPQDLVNSANHMQYLVNENSRLRAQVHALSTQISQLQAENNHLRPFYPPPSDNALALPVAIENLLSLRLHFQKQGTLRQCTSPGCNMPAFDPVCFRLGHMSWCQTHNRIITGNHISCSVRAEERGDCCSVYWVPRLDWRSIVQRAYDNHEIGQKRLARDVLEKALYPPGC